MSGSNSTNPVASSQAAVDPFAMTVHSQPDPRFFEAQQRSGRLRMLLVVAACAAPVLASYFTFYVLKPSGRAYGELITPPVEIPALLNLRDLAGQPVTAASLKGQWLLTLVQDGACDDACEKQLYVQRQLRQMLGKERDKVDKVWLVPDDQPLRPALQKALTEGVPVTILRANRTELEAWLKPAAGQSLRDHFFLIDPRGHWMLRAPALPEPVKLKGDLSRLLKANDSWDEPGR